MALEPRVAHGAHRPAAVPVAVRRVGGRHVPRHRRRRGVPAVPLGVGERAAGLGDRRRHGHAVRHGDRPPQHRGRPARTGPRRRRTPVGAAGRRVRLRRRRQRLPRSGGARDLRWRRVGHRPRWRAAAERRRRRAALRGHRCDRTCGGDRGGGGSRRLAPRYRRDTAGGGTGRRGGPSLGGAAAACPRRRHLYQPLHPAAAGLLAALERRYLPVPGRPLLGPAAVHRGRSRAAAGPLDRARRPSSDVRVAGSGDHRAADDPGGCIGARGVLRPLPRPREPRRRPVRGAPLLWPVVLETWRERDHDHAERRVGRA